MYMKGQTRVSMVPEKNTPRLEGAGMLSFGSKVTGIRQTRDWERCPHKKREDAHILWDDRLKSQLT